MKDLNNRLFIKLYNDIENQIIIKYKLPENYQGALSYYTKKIEKNSEKRAKLDQIRRLRNFIVHEDTIKEYEMFYVTDDLILFLKEFLYQLVDPLNAYDICIKKEQLFVATYRQVAKEIMEKMAEKGFSHVPILNDDGMVVGVFSESTLFSYFLKKKSDDILHSSSLIQEYEEYIKLENHSSERFEFVCKEEEVIQIIKKFKFYEKSPKKLKMIFVTKSGKETEKLLGVITPFDLLKIES